MGTTADKLARLNETKALLKTRLTEKGVDVASENNFYNLADKVGEIQSGGKIEKCLIHISSSELQKIYELFSEDQMSNYGLYTFEYSGNIDFNTYKFQNWFELRHAVGEQNIYIALQTISGPSSKYIGTWSNYASETFKTYIMFENDSVEDIDMYIFADFSNYTPPT